MKDCCPEARHERNRGLIFILIVVILLVLTGEFNSCV